MQVTVAHLICLTYRSKRFDYLTLVYSAASHLRWGMKKWKWNNLSHTGPDFLCQFREITKLVCYGSTASGHVVRLYTDHSAKLIFCSYPHIRVDSDTLCGVSLGTITIPYRVHMAANWNNDTLQAPKRLFPSQENIPKLWEFINDTNQLLML